MRARTDRPYWIEGGTERCPGCGHAYVYETECRCVSCDRGICCHCVRRHAGTADVLCPECEREGEEE